MARVTLAEIKGSRLDAMSAEERAEFDDAFNAAGLALFVGDEIRTARVVAGLSQRDLAARARMGWATVSRLEAGDTGTTLATLQRVAAALGLTLRVELSTD